MSISASALVVWGFISGLGGAVFTGASAAFTALAAFKARDSVVAMKEQLETEKGFRTADDERKVAEDRLVKLYGPLYGVLIGIQYREAAHFYLGLSRSNRREFLNVLSENIYYGDAELNASYFELMANLSLYDMDPDDDDNNKNIELIYHHLRDCIFETHAYLREKLGLPSLDVGDVTLDRSALYERLEKAYPDGFPEKELRQAVKEFRDQEQEEMMARIIEKMQSRPSGL